MKETESFSEKLLFHGQCPKYQIKKLTQYCFPDQSNSSIEKAGLLGSVPMRLLPTDDKCRLRGTTLEQAIKIDREKGLIPCYVSTLVPLSNKQTNEQ
jgi:aromatic-L-amino-acid decarboxylase